MTEVAKPEVISIGFFKHMLDGIEACNSKPLLAVGRKGYMLHTRKAPSSLISMINGWIEN